MSVDQDPKSPDPKPADGQGGEQQTAETNQLDLSAVGDKLVSLSIGRSKQPLEVPVSKAIELAQRGATVEDIEAAKAGIKGRIATAAQLDEFQEAAAKHPELAQALAETYERVLTGAAPPSQTGSGEGGDPAGEADGQQGTDPTVKALQLKLQKMEQQLEQQTAQQSQREQARTFNQTLEANEFVQQHPSAKAVIETRAKALRADDPTIATDVAVTLAAEEIRGIMSSKAETTRKKLEQNRQDAGPALNGGTPALMDNEKELSAADVKSGKAKTAILNFMDKARKATAGP